MSEIKQGSKWNGSGGSQKVFVVLHEVVTDGQTWIHYREEFGDPPMEYSCYKESFLSRFTKLPD